MPVWNASVRLTIFLVTATLLSGLRRALDRERDVSSTDALTGVANTRAFYQRAAAEIERARRYRHALTLAYLDLDNFKQLNDRSGHAAGDSATLPPPVSVDDLVKSADSLMYQVKRHSKNAVEYEVRRESSPS